MKIAIDAGHGSSTAGKRTVDGYKEHWINVKTAAYAKAAAERCGLTVVKIGWDDTNAKDDVDVPIITRQKQVRTNGCTVCVSFHANAHGTGTKWTSAQGASAHIHSVETNQKNSKQMANAIMKYLPHGTEQKNRGVCTGNLGMCNAKYMGVKAAVLVEIGFMTNEHEAELMKTDKFCKEQAEDVIRGVCEFLGIKYNDGKDVKYKTTAPLRMRTAASLNGTIKTVVPEGETVVHLGDKEKENDITWFYCERNGMKGWMSSKYLVKA